MNSSHVSILSVELSVHLAAHRRLTDDVERAKFQQLGEVETAATGDNGGDRVGQNGRVLVHDHEKLRKNLKMEASCEELSPTVPLLALRHGQTVLDPRPYHVIVRGLPQMFRALEEHLGAVGMVDEDHRRHSEPDHGDLGRLRHLAGVFCTPAEEIVGVAGNAAEMAEQRFVAGVFGQPQEAQADEEEAESFFAGGQRCQES